jgi:hypothetical protein
MTGASPYGPPSAQEPVEAVINTIFDAARRGRLVMCAGAGMSRASPTDLPSGAELGNRLNERLESLISGYVAPEHPENLIAVADAGADLEGGEDALRSEVLKLARFLDADPNYGHQVVAELLGEGAIEVLLLWNWDDCIERVDVTPERLQVARSRRDLEDLEQPSIAKIHGCATRRRTLLITSADLDEPPFWADEAFKERLRGKTVVFVGVGDIADYAQRRLEELRQELAADAEDGARLPDIWVVSPTIRSEWDASQWATLMPELPEERRVQMSADEFLDQLARRWVREAIDELEQSAGPTVRSEVADSLRQINAALCSMGAARVLRWCRRAALGQAIGTSVALCDGLKQVLLAYAVLATDRGVTQITARSSAALEVGDQRIEALIACEAGPADKVRQRARRRAEELANHGTIGDTATFLVSGVVWGALPDDADSELEIATGPTDPQDLVAGPSGVRLSFIKASELEAAA